MCWNLAALRVLSKTSCPLVTFYVLLAFWYYVCDEVHFQVCFHIFSGLRIVSVTICVDSWPYGCMTGNYDKWPLTVKAHKERLRLKTARFGFPLAWRVFVGSYNIYVYNNSTATLRSTQLNGSQRPEYTTNQKEWIQPFINLITTQRPNRWSAHMAVQSDSNECNT